MRVCVCVCVRVCVWGGGESCKVDLNEYFNSAILLLNISLSDVIGAAISLFWSIKKVFTCTKLNFHYKRFLVRP